MILVILTALAAVCGAAKLDKSYVPPITAKTAGGSSGDLLAPLEGSNQGLPTGSYTNEVQGVVVDAANPGTRTSGQEPTGLGGPRVSYGSTDSKVGDAAFTGSQGSLGPTTRIAPGFGSFVDSDGTRSDKTSSLKFTSDVGLDNYSYGFETDNGISVGENGVAADGVKAEGGYSYKGDDGKTYSVSYTADEGGYKPQGQHLPTPPPIPNEILISLEKNAKEEAAGHVDDGSYDAQKYNNEGDYSSNGASNNNGSPTIGGDATSSGSHVSQSSQVHRPTSGVLSGAYNPGSDATHSTQGHSAQGFSQSGNKQSSFSHGTSSQDVQIENRFGVQATQSDDSQAHAQASVANTPVRSQTFNSPGASAFSSAVATGSGSSSAFASAGPSSSGFKNEYIPPFNSFGSAVQNTLSSKSDSSAGASFPAPSTATASASVSGSQTQGSGFHKYSQSSNLPSSASTSASTSGNQQSFSHSNQQVIESNSNTFPTRFGVGQQAGSFATDSGYLPPVNTVQSFGKPSSNSKPQGFDSSSAASSANIQPLSQHSSQTQLSSTHTQFSGPQPTQASSGFGSIQGPTKVPGAVLPTPFESNAQSTSVFNHQSSNQASHSSGSNVIPLSLPTPATAIPATPPFISQQQGNDNSYYYQQPSKPFITPPVNSNGQYSNNQQPIIPISTISQQGSKYPNIPASSATGQYQGTSSSSNNGITQAAVSPFTSDSSSSSTQFASQSSQFSSKPTTQLSLPSQQTSTQFGSTETHSGHKPIVQSQTQFGQPTLSFNQNSGTYQSTTQQNQGTIYQYNKPISTLPAQGHKDTSSSFGQASFSQTNSQGKPGQIATGTRFGTQQSSSQFGSQSSFQQAQIGSNTQTSQFGQKPIVSSQVSGSNYQQSQVGNFGSQFGQKPQATQGSTVSSNTNTQTSFGSTTHQFGQKPQTAQGTGLTSTFGQTSFGQKPSLTTQAGSSYQQGQFGTGSQFGSKPVSTTQTGSTSQQGQFGTSGSQFGQNSQSTSGSVSTTVKPSYVQKPFGSSYQQTQVGTPSSQFGQNSQSTHSSGSTSTTSQTSFGIKPVYQQSQFGSQNSQSQTSVFGNKPFSTTQSGVTSQQSQFGSSGFQFGQNSQTAGTGFVSTTVKPVFGSTYPQSQFGSFGSQFGSKPQTTQGSSFTYNQASSQSSQFGKKPVSTIQTGVTSHQTQFGSSGSQFGQNSQTTVGSGLVSTTVKPSFSQKPVGSTTYQQGQFGSFGSQFGSKPQTTQGSSYTYNQASSPTSQFGKKPVITTQTGVTSQQNQFGSFGSQFGQNSQTTAGSGLDSTTAKPSFSQKPFGSTTYQQGQFGSVGSQFGTKPQTSQSSSFTYNQASSQTSQFGKKPVSTAQTGASSQQTQFGSSGSQFGQNSQSTQSSAVALTTPKPVAAIKPVYQQPQFGSSGSKFGQTSQSTHGFSTITTTAKPAYGQTSFGSASQQTQFGSQFGQKPQTTQGSSFTSNTYSQSQSQFGIKPSVTGTAFPQTQFGSASSLSGQKPLTTTVTGVTSTTTPAPFGQKPSSTAQTGSYYHQSQFGSSGSQFGQKPQSTQQGSSFTSNTGSKGQVVQTSQFGVTGSSQNTGSSFQSNNISGSSSASGTNFQQTQSSGSSGSQTTQGTNSQAQPVQSIQNGIKPFGSSQNTQGSTQFIATPTRFGVTPQTNVPTSTTVSHPVQPTQFGQKPSQTPFGSSFGHFGQKPHASAFATNSGNNVIPFGITQVTDQVSNHQQTSQFGGQYHGVTSTQKPLLSSLSQNHYQHYQYSQNSDKSGTQSQFGQTSNSNVGSGQFGHTTFGAQSQKPFGSQSTQTTYQQTQFNQGQKPFGSSQGSTFQTGQSVVDQPTQGTSQTINIAGYNYLKPQTGFTTQHGGQASGHQDQNFQQTQSNLNSIVSTTQAPITGQSHKPFEISSSQGTFQSQSNVGSSQFGTEQIKPTQFTGPIIQTSFNQFSGQPFKPANTASTLGSTVQSQASAVSTSQFGSLHGSNIGSQTGSTLQYNVLPSHGVVLQSSKPSHFSVEPHNHGVFSTTQAPSFPTRVGSNEGLVVSTVQTPIVPVPGYEIVTSAQASSHGVAGLGEQFGGPRDPPRFDDKTGYHY